MTFLRFIAAVFVGVGYSLFTWNKPWARAKGFFWLWWDSTRVIQAGDEQKKERLAICEKCPIFYHPLRTCGSPLADDPSLGCWCQMDVKARMSSASCWIKDHESHRTGFGWRDGL